MSYCRFGWDGSNVYIFENVNGSLECCGCSLDDYRHGQWNWTDIAEFFAHLNEHIARGDTVPPTVIGEITEDWKAGRFAEWDTTDPQDMEPYLNLPKVVDSRSYIEFLAENRDMLGWDDEQFEHFKTIWRDKQNENRSEATDRPATE